ncbi:MAG: peroxidase family protein [Pirellulaceae bacterium]|nr:peroxidase family protein [Pirellulaceae bacterium]
MKKTTLRLGRKVRLETLERRELMAADLTGLMPSRPLPPSPLGSYSIDGTGNNLAQSEWGSTNETLLRLAASEYSDGVSSPNGTNRPSPREISNVLADQGSEDIISDRNLSAFVYVWGQFIDHDIGLTPTGSSEPMSISVPTGDPYFDPQGTGSKAIRTARSIFDAATGTSSTNPREQVNTLTSWLDASMVYGSDSATAFALRTLQGGRLKMSSDGMLPLNNAENFPNGTVSLVNDAHRVPDNQLFAAGDVRANENIELTSLQTVFVREHNRFADRLAQLNPQSTDEEIYFRARSMVIAEIQAITFNEWLPAVLGPNAMRRYAGYNPKVNPGLSNEFSTAAFRFGHSLLGDDVEFLDNNGRPVAEEIPLSEAFFNPTVFQTESIDSIFKYLASDPSSEFDTKIVGGVRNFLFGQPGQGGFDLASLNIQRGRDHALADYNDVRAAIGLPRARIFADITRNKDTQAKLQQLYGSVDNIDLWVGVLAEDHLPGSSVGPTASRIIADQFSRIRAGDRFWYENQFSGQLLRELDSTKLSDILKRNTTLTNLQSNVFIFDSRIEGSVFADLNGNARRESLEMGLAGWTVELVSSDIVVVSTQLSNRSGGYQFDVASGIRTDRYEIRITKDPSGVSLSSPVVRMVEITRGNQYARNVDLPIAVPKAISTPPIGWNRFDDRNCVPPLSLPPDASAFDSLFAQLADERRRVGR